ncbi:MAG: inositol monophosphatase family protein [Candidatus Eisenbacteria bacterium]|nr:inositol monophosphatase family protein [Candidatus Eisenbacteria bacterium]
MNVLDIPELVMAGELVKKKAVSTKEMAGFLKVATSVAVQAGEILAKNFGKTQKVELKGEIDLVTDIDRRSQEFIVGKLGKAFPDHSIMAEEALFEKKHSQYLWIIDPLDGTTNYAHGFPVFCVSIALQFEKTMVAGVIHNPLLGETFSAGTGMGTRLNGKRVVVSKTRLLTNSLLATGFPYDLRKHANEYLRVFCDMAVRARAVRRAGSAALDLAYLACGRFDGFWEMKLKPWDIAAGALMVKEAGGRTTDYDGCRFDLRKGSLAASNGRIHRELLAALELTKRMRRS